MNRHHLQFGCGDYKLAGTLDNAPGKTGLLIVTGGNEVRSGAFSGQSHLAEQVAKAGFPVFRFDRRGIGDSEGTNRGFRKSRKDIRAAIEAFRALAPQIDRVVGLGNCDAASALMLASGAGCDMLVLSNPWTIEDSDDASDLPPPDAVRSRYLDKLRNPAEVKRLLTGGVDLRKLARGLASTLRSKNEQTGLAEEMRAGLAEFPGEVRILLATSDRTAQLFESAWDKNDTRISRCEGASHAYVEPEARDWMLKQVLSALRS